MLETMRFWLERGVDGFRLDTVNYYFHDDQRLRDNPPPSARTAAPGQPLRHAGARLFEEPARESGLSGTHLRALTDAYDARTLVGEWATASARSRSWAPTRRAANAAAHGLFLRHAEPFFAPAYFRQKIAAVLRGRARWLAVLVVLQPRREPARPRWEKYGESPEALAKLSIALLAGFEGTIGIYQGEELGQTETDLHYDELTDPVGLRFWPENKGRDGCRTPMAWDGGGANAGFSDGTPWLPVKPPQAARNVAAQEDDPDSVLHHYRAVLAFRRSRPSFWRGKTRVSRCRASRFWPFTVRLEKTALTCVYNLSPGEVTLTVTGRRGSRRALPARPARTARHSRSGRTAMPSCSPPIRAPPSR
jgi:alpha-glucosidase